MGYFEADFTKRHVPGSAIGTDAEGGAPPRRTSVVPAPRPAAGGAPAMDNPYAPPVAGDEPRRPALLSNAERIRNEHIGHEASVRAIGTLHYLGCIGMALMAVSVVVYASGAPDGRYAMIGAAFMVLIACVDGALGYGLRALAGWARWPTVGFSALGLLAFPVGTLINGYILYLMVSQKGQVVFSDSYKDIIAQTPHIKYKTSIVVTILVCVLVLLLLAGLVAGFVADH